MPVAWWVGNFFLHCERDLSCSLNELFHTTLLGDLVVDLYGHRHIHFDLGRGRHLDSLIEFDLRRHILRNRFCHFSRYFDLSVYLDDDRHLNVTRVFNYYWDALSIVFEVLDRLKDFSRNLDNFRPLLDSSNCILLWYLILFEHLHILVTDLRCALADGKSADTVSRADTRALGDVAGAVDYGKELVGDALID